MKRKLGLLFLVVAGVPMCLLLLSMTRLLTGNLDEMLARRAEESLSVARNLFQDVLEGIALKTQIIAQFKDIKEAARTRDIIELIDKVSIVNHDLGLQRYDAVTEIYDASGVQAIAEPRTRLPPCDGQTIQAAVKGSITSFREIVEDRLRICSVVPLHHESVSTPIGVAALSLFATHPFADEIKNVVGGEVILFTSKDGKPLLLGSSFMRQGVRLLPTLPDDAASLSWLVWNVGGTAYRFQFASLEARNGRFFLGTAVEMTVIAQAAASLRSHFLLIGIAAAIFAIILAILFSRTLTRPIGRLVEAASSLGAGNLDAKITISSGDELEFLGETFDSMRLKVKENIEQITAAKNQLDRKVFDLSLRNLINQAIIGKKEAQVIEEILRILVETLGASVGTILLSDPDTGLLTPRFSTARARKTGGGTAKIPAPATDVLEAATQVTRTGIPAYTVENSEDQDGKPKTRCLLALPLKGEKGLVGVLALTDRPGGFTQEDVLLLLDLSDQVAIAIQKALLYELAITDGLTGLFLHRYFQMRLDGEIAKARRQRTTVSLILFDIDHFKKINDTYGHQLGDQVLKRVAEVVRQGVREGIDVAARYGGEEFAVILPETNLDGAFRMAERLRISVEGLAIPHEGKNVFVTISLGCAAFPEHADQKAPLILEADKALYKSKATGRNRTSLPGK